MSSVLIIEDVPEMCEHLALLVSQVKGVHRVVQSANLWEARIELSKNRPDLILLDEVLPGESSFDFCEELLKQSIRCLLMTGMEDRANVRLPRGVLDRFRKPGLNTSKSDHSVFISYIRKYIES
jgi:response regulator of citrate/malate metabolism